MAKIEPFLNTHYNPEVIQDFSKVTCPPYDIIGAQAQEEYYEKHTYNMIRLILGKDFDGDKPQENKYTRAAAYLEDWLRRGVLIQDTEPAIYFYEQVFTMQGGPKKKRLGFIALLKFDEEGKDKFVYPHEHTHILPKEDRFKLIKNVEANLSPIFTIFSDRNSVLKGIFEESISCESVFCSAVDNEGTENRLWRITQQAIIDKIKSFLADKEVFIADGHHRYEVARMFRDHKRENDKDHFKDTYNYIMTYFTPLEDDGLCILPTHRLIKNTHFTSDDLSRCFTVKEVSSRDVLVAEMKAKEDEVGFFGLYKDKKFYILKISEKRECNRCIQEGPKEYKNLDVVILHKVLFENILKIGLTQISYEVNLNQAIGLVDGKAFDALFILNPTKIEQIRSIALAGQVMPQKSTYFYPKLLSGFLIYQF